MFPNLTYTEGNGYAGNFGKYYNRFIKGRGIVAKPKTRKVFHSFRSTVANTLKQKDVAQNKIQEILGHDDPSMSTGHYAETYEMSILYEALLKLDYGLDFSGIKFPVK